jgi:HEAT repeat protein
MPAPPVLKRPMIRNLFLVLSAAAIVGPSVAAAQQVRFDDVVRNLRNPDPKIRVNAVRLLRESGYGEAIGPIVPLINDPVDDIQLEAIGAELSFYLVEPVPSKKRVALLIEVRNPGQAPAAFEMGPLATWQRPVPPELVTALLQAVDDENARVRTEAIYTLGVISHGPLSSEQEQALIKALDHYDAGIRTAAARVIGRLEVAAAGDALVKAINDSNEQVRYAAMRALGEIHEERAVEALTEQLTYYSKGEGAWSAMYALARIAHPSSLPVFKARVADKDQNIRRAAMEGLGRLKDTSELSALQVAAGSDQSEMVRAAASFALQMLERNYIPRLVESMDSAKMAPQIAGYLIELGPTVVPQLLSHLQDQDPVIRANVAQVLGAIGGDAALAALQPLLQDRDETVVEAATRAIERAKTAHR